jgi:hypothetical protein
MGRTLSGSVFELLRDCVILFALLTCERNIICRRFDVDGCRLISTPVSFPFTATTK